jgi:hypothetical protein
MKLDPENHNVLKITKCEGVTLAHKLPLLVSKEINQFVDMWSNYLNIYPHNFEKTHVGNFFLLVAENAAVCILLVEDPACVLYDGTK